MVILFIVVANEVLECIGPIACGGFDPVELVRLWQVGALEVLFEGYLGGRVVKIYNKVRGRGTDVEDRGDIILDELDE